MRLVNFVLAGAFFKLDKPMEKLQEIRDSYRQLNVEIYGEEMARMLNDW